MQRAEGSGDLTLGLKCPHLVLFPPKDGAWVEISNTKEG